MTQRYWITTLGCPKNQVDSEKIEGQLLREGLEAAESFQDADVVVVNTCAFIESAREESVETILDAAEEKREGARLIVTGCMAERYGKQLEASLHEVDQVAGFGVPLQLSATRNSGAFSATRKPGAISISQKPPRMDLLNMPRPKSHSPWAYVKIAEGCDRACGFCAIPSFRGKQQSRSRDDILREVDELEVKEVVLIAQDLASYGNDLGNRRAIVPLVRDVMARVERVRLLYLYPSDLSEELIDVICESGIPYFDLSLQHVSAPLLRRMRRWGEGDRFLERVRTIRSRAPEAAFRSNFIVGYPGETEADHDQLRAFVEEADMEWCSFFSYSNEEGTYAATLDQHVSDGLIDERIRELRELQDAITARKRASLIDDYIDVLVDAPGVARSHREAPEIDGIIEVPTRLEVGSVNRVKIIGSSGPDLQAIL